MAKNVHEEPQPYLPTRRWVDGSIADDLPAKRLQRLYSTNHFIVSMVNPIVVPFIKRRGQPSPVRQALGGLGVGLGREFLNFYRGIVQQRHDTWPRFNMFMSSVHGLLDQNYRGDINIVPTFRWYNPAKLLSHLSEKDLLALMQNGERSTYPRVEAIRICTKISRTMEEILLRFEQGDLRPEDSQYHRPRSSRRRPPPNRADREALREHRVLSDQVAKPSTGAKKPTARTKRKGSTVGKSAGKRKSPAKGGTRRARAAA